MVVTLEKGNKVTLTKGDDGIEKVRAGLKWSSRCDVDSSVITLNKDGKLAELIYFGNKRSRDGAIVHRGDDTTGSNIQGVDGDNENIDIDLKGINPDVQELLIVTNVYNGPSRNQDFSNIGSVRVRITDLSKNIVIASYELQGKKGINAAIVSRIYRRPNGAWNMEAVGDEFYLKNGQLSELVQKYRGKGEPQPSQPSVVSNTANACNSSSSTIADKAKSILGRFGL